MRNNLRAHSGENSIANAQFSGRSRSLSCRQSGIRRWFCILCRKESFELRWNVAKLFS
jgi:hypothetical protein